MNIISSISSCSHTVTMSLVPWSDLCEDSSLARRLRGSGGGETVHRLSLYSWNSLRQVNKTSHLYPARIQSKQPLLFWCLVILKNMNLNVFPKWPLLTGQVLGKKQLEVKLYSYSSIRALNLDYFNAAGWRARGPASARCFARFFSAYTCSCVSQTNPPQLASEREQADSRHPRKCVCVTGVRQTNVTPSSGLGKWLGHDERHCEPGCLSFLPVCCSRLWHSLSDEGESPTSEMSVTFFTCFVGETCLMSVIASNHMNTHQFTETALRSNARLIVDVWGWCRYRWQEVKKVHIQADIQTVFWYDRSNVLNINVW